MLKDHQARVIYQPESYKRIMSSFHFSQQSLLKKFHALKPSLNCILVLNCKIVIILEMLFNHLLNGFKRNTRTQ